jgi:hypothetical protein
MLPLSANPIVLIPRTLRPNNAAARNLVMIPSHIVLMRFERHG